MRNRWLYIVLIIFFSGCAQQGKGNKHSKRSHEKEIEFQYDTDVYVTDGNDTLISFRTELADTPYKRQTGLMYRKQMADNQAMLFIFPDEQVRYFYMKNTLIPLDIIYIDGNKEIVSIVHHAVPLDETSLPSGSPAKYVLEIKGGIARRAGIKKGMKIHWNDKK